MKESAEKTINGMEISGKTDWNSIVPLELERRNRGCDRKFAEETTYAPKRNSNHREAYADNDVRLA